MKPTLSIGHCHAEEYQTQRSNVDPGSRSCELATALLSTAAISALIEECCSEAIGPHLHESELSVCTYTSMNYFHPVLRGSRITVLAACVRVDGDIVEWSVSARDDVGIVVQALHARRVVDYAEFGSAIRKKATAQRATGGLS
jgi:predicted thioesterase